jgi:hypothetical protein
MIMPNEPEATVPAMDVERRAEQLYAEFYNVPPLDRMTSAVWSELSTTSRGPWRARAQSELAEEAKRRGDHDTLREMHGAVLTVTGAAMPAFAMFSNPATVATFAEMTATAEELRVAVVDLVDKVLVLDDSVEDDDKILDATEAAETVKSLLDGAK